MLKMTRPTAGPSYMSMNENPIQIYVYTLRREKKRADMDLTQKRVYKYGNIFGRLMKWFFRFPKAILSNVFNFRCF